MRSNTCVRTSVAVAAVSIAALACSLTAQAAGGREDAARLIDAAYEDVSAGGFAEAIEKFERAYALYPSPETIFNIAVAYDQWGGHCAEAKYNFERYFTVCAGCSTEPVARGCDLRAGHGATWTATGPVGTRKA